MEPKEGYTWQNLLDDLLKLTPDQRQLPARILGESVNRSIEGLWVLEENFINPGNEGWEPLSIYKGTEEYDEDEPIVGKEGEIYLTCE